jgi:hypothetical protein
MSENIGGGRRLGSPKAKHVRLCAVRSTSTERAATPDNAGEDGLTALRRAYNAIPAGSPSDAAVIEKLPTLYAAIEAVLMTAGDGGLDPGNGNQDAAPAPFDGRPSPAVARLSESARATTPARSDAGDGLDIRENGDGYEVQTWVNHQPSGVVVLPGHPQLGGRYCKTDGGDWPCAAVRARLAKDPTDER